MPEAVYPTKVRRPPYDLHGLTSCLLAWLLILHICPVCDTAYLSSVVCGLLGILGTCVIGQFAAVQGAGSGVLPLLLYIVEIQQRHSGPHKGYCPGTGKRRNWAQGGNPPKIGKYVDFNKKLVFFRF